MALAQGFGVFVVLLRDFCVVRRRSVPRKGWSTDQVPDGWLQLVRGPRPQSTKWPVRDRQFSKPPAIGCRGSQVTLQPEASRRGPSPVSRQGSSDEIGGQWQQWAGRTPLSRICQKH